MKTSDTSAIFVIFGGTGDLSHRKLMPALYNLVNDGLLPERFAVVAVGRKEKSREVYQQEVYASLQKYSRNKITKTHWARLRDAIYYFSFDFNDSAGYQRLHTYLEELDSTRHTGGNRIFYLAVAPDYFPQIVAELQRHRFVPAEHGWQRLVIEKPFGKDLSTARSLNSQLTRVFSEDSIYRIDHYLGKEMIQNILVLRFCNSVFTSLWNNLYIDHIQISLSEQDGVGTRGGYYESAGAIRDMVQNHIIQILTLVAMEPPVDLSTDAIRNEKLKVIQAIADFTPEQFRSDVVFGQYGPGMINGQPVPGYRSEPQVSPTSLTETFVAFKLQINNFRWAGTPFYIRTGKRLSSRSAEIAIQFKTLPPILYFKDRMVQEPNLLVIKIQPETGVYFQFNTKDFMSHHDIVATKMDTSCVLPTQGNTPEAYERLIYDILRGDTTLFPRWDEIEAAWKFADQLIAFRDQQRFRFPNYDAGSWGPAKSFELLARDGREWITV